LEIAQLRRTLAQAGVSLRASALREKELGPRTKEAIRRFQTERGLAVTGEVDKATAKAPNQTILMLQKHGLPVKHVRTVAETVSIKERRHEWSGAAGSRCGQALRRRVTF